MFEGAQMDSGDIEQRYWRHQLLHFASSLLLYLSMIPFVFMLRVNGVSDRAGATRLSDSPQVFYIGIATALLLAALILSRISIRRLSYREMGDPRNQARLQDEHERSLRYRAGYRALWSIVVLQALLYAWTMLTPLGLPSLPPGLSPVVTLLAAHLVFWVPYLRQTK